MSIHEKGWIFIQDKNDILLQEALKIKDRVLDKDSSFYRISGEHTQCDIAVYSWTRTFQTMLANQAKEHLEKNSIDTKNLVPRHLKLLESKPTSSRQAPHRDGLKKDEYVVAYYLSENKTTDMCNLPYPTEDIGTLTNDEKKRMDPNLWNELVSFDNKPGDMMIFSEDVIHRGIKNTTKENRYVIFTVLGPKDKTHSDKYQHFEWTWYSDIYGFGSEKHLESIDKNKEYKPLMHEGAKNKKTLTALIKSRKRKR